MTTATPSVSSGCSFDDFTATNNDQVRSVQACATAVGDVFISGSNIDQLDLTGVREFYGDLKINGTKATVFNAPDLQLVSGQFTLSRLTLLGNVNLAQLTTVGTLVFDGLPALEQTGLSSGITSAESITISNTGLHSLEGINVFKLKVFDVNNNADIESIDSALQSVTDLLQINYNADKVEVVLDELTLANDVVFEKISSLSTANLTSINGSLSLSKNKFDSFEFKQLEQIGKSLSINDNDELEEFDFPKLKSIGGALNIADNENLKSFSYFDKLETIGGSVNIDGDFDNGTFPELNRVAGGFNLSTTGELSCAEFTKLNSKGDVRGDKFYCRGASSTVSSSSSKSGNSNGESTSSSGSGSGSGSSGSSSSSSGSGSSSSGSSAAGVAGVSSSLVLLVTFVLAFSGVGVAMY